MRKTIPYVLPASVTNAVGWDTIIVTCPGRTQGDNENQNRQAIITYKTVVYVTLLMCYLETGFAFGQDSQTVGADFAVSSDNVPQKDPVYSPYVGQSHPDRVYWGDSHLHTSARR